MSTSSEGLDAFVATIAAAFDLELDETTVRRMHALWRRLSAESRASLEALLCIELATERGAGVALDAESVLRAAERVAKRVQRQVAARRERQEELDRSIEDGTLVSARSSDVGLSDDTREALWDAIRTQVTVDELALLHARFVEGRSVVELAVESGSSRSQMTRRLRALLDRLASPLRDHHDGEPES